MKMLSKVFCIILATTKSADVRLAYFVVGLFFFGYVLARAIWVGATYDELWSMNTSRDNSVFGILVNKGSHANNHVLNTLLIKLLFLFDSGSLFLARLPNLVAFVLYMYFGYKIAFRNLSSIVGVGFFILLLCNPFLLEFFGLARGYGLSIAFMVGALYFSSELIKLFSLRKLWWSLVLGALSVLSLFSMVYFFVVLVATVVLVPILRRDGRVFKQTLSRSLLVGLGLFPVFFISVWRMYKLGSLYHGGTHGFYSDTLFSLVEYSLFDPRFTSLALNSFLVVIFLAMTAAMFFYRKEWLTFRDMVVGVTAMLVLMTIAAHHLGGVRYPVDRVALFFYPLFVLVFCFCLDDFGRYIKYISLSSLIMVCVANFSLDANFYKTKVWPFDAHISKILREINNKGEQMGRVLTVVFPPLLNHSVNYYLSRYDYLFVSALGKGADEATIDRIDYYIFSVDGQGMTGPFLDIWEALLADSHKAIFLEYPAEGIYVYTKSLTTSPSP